jgi:hypothetical protein
MNDYTSLQVSDKIKNDPAMHVGVGKIVFSPISHFFRKFISQQGYKDGMHGLLLAVLGAIYTLGLYAKLWEYRMRVREGQKLLPPITNIEVQRVKRFQ